MSKPGDVWVSKCGKMELRCGRWQDVLTDIESCDAVITDPPFSERTHKGALSCTGERGINGYVFLKPKEAQTMMKTLSKICSGWIVVHTDPDLCASWIAEAELCGRYTFSPLPVLQHQPRLTGDGPPAFGHYLCVSRPRRRVFLSWGSLPGWYECRRDGSIVRGGKPLSLMQEIVRDYSRPGDLVVDPCAGGGTTLLAAAIEGRRAIGAEMDPKTFDLAVKRLSKGYTPRMAMPSRTKPKQESML